MWPFPNAEFLLDGVLGWLAKAIVATLKALWGLLEQTAFTSPDVTTLPQVVTISGRSQMIVNTAFVLAIIAVGVTVMTHETVQVRYGVGDLVPRMVIGFIAANFATPICAQLIEIANALTGALTGDGIAADGSFEHMQRVVEDALTNETGAFLLVIIGLIIAVLTGMLLVAMLIRIGVLVVLVGIAPAALACLATPFTDPVAKLWCRSMLGVLATVVLQALAMHTALSVFLDPDANLAALGIPHDPAGVGNLFIVACLLWVTVQIPGMMRRYVTRGGQQNAAGMFLRMLLIQPVSRFVRPPFGRAAGRGRAAGGARAPASGTAGGSSAATVVPYWRPRMPRPTPASRPATGNPTALTPAGGTSAATAGNADSGGPSAGGSSGPPRRTVPAGTTPATVMPVRRPRWQAYGARPSSTGWPDPPVRGATGNRPTPATGRPSGTGWPGTRVRPAGDPRYPVTGQPRPGGNRGS
ncbi:conjugal transfer protein TrbL family protein [Actinoplanes sp. NPDC049668]|uniref:conjugal transfer protein TrbL family protein n=1 Tax=unclassified Actinoplanes TaxID=2626549 RepID=UPI0033A1138A